MSQKYVYSSTNIWLNVCDQKLLVAINKLLTQLCWDS